MSASSAIKLNLGSADLYLDGYTNIDISTSDHIKADLTADVLDLSRHFTPESVDEVWAAHLVEHLAPEQVESAVEHWKSLLKSGGILAIVTPDFRVLCEHYLQGDMTIERMEDEFVYSYVQESHHQSIWDQERLFDLFSRHGFTDLKPIDRFNDPRLAYKDSLQCGVEGKKP